MVRCARSVASYHQGKGKLQPACAYVCLTINAKMCAPLSRLRRRRSSRKIEISAPPSPPTTKRSRSVIDSTTVISYLLPIPHSYSISAAYFISNSSGCHWAAVSLATLGCRVHTPRVATGFAVSFLELPLGEQLHATVIVFLPRQEALKNNGKRPAVRRQWFCLQLLTIDTEFPVCIFCRQLRRARKAMGSVHWCLSLWYS